MEQIGSTEPSILLSAFDNIFSKHGVADDLLAPLFAVAPFKRFIPLIIAFSIILLNLYNGFHIFCTQLTSSLAISYFLSKAASFVKGLSDQRIFCSTSDSFITVMVACRSEVLAGLD